MPTKAQLIEENEKLNKSIANSEIVAKMVTEQVLFLKEQLADESSKRAKAEAMMLELIYQDSGTEECKSLGDDSVGLTYSQIENLEGMVKKKLEA